MPALACSPLHEKIPHCPATGHLDGGRSIVAHVSGVAGEVKSSLTFVGKRVKPVTEVKNKSGCKNHKDEISRLCSAYCFAPPF